MFARTERSQLNQQKDQLALEKRTYKDQLRRKSEREINTLKEEMDAALEALKKSSDLKLHEIQAAKALFNQRLDTPLTNPSETIEVGDRVDVKKFNRPGQVKAIKRNLYTVQMGNLEMVLRKDELSFIKKDVLEKPIDTKVHVPTSKMISGECDLRGLRVEEAQETLLKYIDDCSVSRVPFVRIIHGFGTLALRKMVKDVVQASPLIKSSRDGQGNEGGNGVTVIYFE